MSSARDACACSPSPRSPSPSVYRSDAASMPTARIRTSAPAAANGSPYTSASRGSANTKMTRANPPLSTTVMREKAASRACCSSREHADATFGSASAPQRLAPTSAPVRPRKWRRSTGPPRVRRGTTSRPARPAEACRPAPGCRDRRASPRTSSGAASRRGPAAAARRREAPARRPRRAPRGRPASSTTVGPANVRTLDGPRKQHDDEHESVQGRDEQANGVEHSQPSGTLVERVQVTDRQIERRVGQEEARRR